jgi:hypothetical protein
MEENELNEDEKKAEGGSAKNIRISWGEILLITPAILFTDLIEMIGNLADVSVFLLAAGLLLDFLADFIGFMVQFYLIMKGIGFAKNLTYFIGNLIELIPFLSFLPIRTMVWIFTVYIVNYPDSFLARSFSKIEGKVGGALGSKK